jgi:hypothetical protein
MQGYPFERVPTDRRLRSGDARRRAAAPHASLLDEPLSGQRRAPSIPTVD